MLKNRFTVMLLLATGLFSQIVMADKSIEVSDAWIPDAPSVAKVRAGYLTVHNNSKAVITISHFSSPDFKKTMLHNTVLKDGMVQMEAVDQLSIKPGGKVDFKAESYHLMLINPKQKLYNGKKVKLRIHLKDGKTSSFTAVVRRRGESNDNDHSQHDMK